MKEKTIRKGHLQEKYYICKKKQLTWNVIAKFYLYLQCRSEMGCRHSWKRLAFICTE